MSDRMYWEERARDLGDAAVVNVADAHRVDETTARQRSILFPLLKSELRGDERRILDFGCGSGRFTADLGKLIKGEAVGVDPSPTLISLATGGENARFLVMETDAIPLADSSMDVVWSTLVFGAITKNREVRYAVREIERVLRPDGLLFLAENTADRPSRRRWRFRPVDQYLALFPAIPLRQIGSYDEVGRTISVFAGRRTTGVGRSGDDET